jgi:hypothetical protein
LYVSLPFMCCWVHYFPFNWCDVQLLLVGSF